MAAEDMVPVDRTSLEWLARQEYSDMDRAYVAMEAISMARRCLINVAEPKPQRSPE